MAKKKTETETKDEGPKRVIIRAKTPMAWKELLTKAEAEHWRTLRCTIQIRDKLYAGKPASLNAASAMLKARNLEDFVATAEDVTDPVERKALADKVSKEEGLCEFSRRNGYDGIWIPSNNIKAGLKENWSVLGLRVLVRGSRGALAEGLFVNGVDGAKTEDRDWVKVGLEPTGVLEEVAHTTGASGPVSSIKRHEYMLKPKITFDVMIAHAEAVSTKISDDELAKCLIHFSEHGLGACRSQGHGRFDILEMKEVESTASPN